MEYGSALILFAVILGFLASGIWIFVGLIFASFFGLYFLADMPIYKIMAIFSGNLWTKATTWEFACIPLFVWMGELILRTDVAERMFRGLSPWVQWLPGRLIHTNILGCTLFAAISGSSAATTVTVGKITSNTLLARGYSPRLAVGSLAGAGTLGLLLPPSIILIVYGNLAETSIARLFAAGVLPGLMLAGMFLLYTVVACMVFPGLAPVEETTNKLTVKERIASIIDLMPIVILISLVLGGIYSGIATPTESAALGVVLALLMAMISRCLTLKLIFSTLLASIGTSVMVITIIIAATFLTSTMGYLQIPQTVSHAVAAWNISSGMLIAMVFLLYLALGCFLEGISLLVMTLPVVLPLVVHAGYDPVWFGILAVIAIEIAQITPPVGLNLFVLQGLTGRGIMQLVTDSFPFFVILCIAALIITLQPEIVLWLPDLLYNH